MCFATQHSWQKYNKSSNKIVESSVESVLSVEELVFQFSRIAVKSKNLHNAAQKNVMSRFARSICSF